jgi:hypothetical protein
MRRAASDPATLALPFSFYYTHSSHLSFYLILYIYDPRGLGLLATFQFHFLVLRSEAYLNFSYNQKRERGR